MKKIFLIILLFSVNYFAQIEQQIKCPINLETILPSAKTSTVAKNANGIIQGGKKKTASGILRVLVIFVRFKDDNTNTASWPNYQVLPNWAANFVDSQVPSNNIYQNINLSKYFDMESGGNGNGTLGQFQVIGDVYYVTTDKNRSQYRYDSEVNLHVLQKLDNYYNVDFRKYDNWKFMVNGEDYNHSYVPFNPQTGTGGDGKLDHIFINWRDSSFFYSSSIGGYNGIETNFTSNDGVIINDYDGSTQFNVMNKGGNFLQNRYVYVVCAHEYCHFLFGGSGNIKTHFDGEAVHNSHPDANIGNISRFALMTSAESHGMCAYEKYRLGWIEPRIYQTNSSSISLQDTHVKNDVIMIPLKYDNQNNLIEYYLIENFQTLNSYSQASPFKVKKLFNHNFSKGLLVYHIENENLNFPTASILDIECADGLWNWDLSTGAYTPNNRNDDKLVRVSINRNNGLDERDYIPLTVGNKFWNDYMPLTPSSGGEPNHGRRYHQDNWLGDENDFFSLSTEKVFTKWSNPTTVRFDGTQSNFGFEISSYNSSTHTYFLNLGFNENTIKNFSPSKPQNLKTVSNGTHPELSWEANIEPNLKEYWLYRKKNNGSFYKIATISKTATSYTDNTITFLKPIFGEYTEYYYKLKAVNTNNLSSLFSNTAHISGYVDVPTRDLPKNNTYLLSETINKIKTYSLENYPNPFNPTTEIEYQIPKEGHVSLIVYNSLGEEIKTLVNENKASGSYKVSFNAENLPSGIYYYKLQSGEFIKVKKMLLLK